MVFEAIKDVWCLVAMRADGDGWVVDCCARMAEEVRNTSPHIEDLFNLGDPLPVGAGMHVWEGEVHVSGDGREMDFDVSYIGSWRRASAAEVIAFVKGRVRTPTEDGHD